MFGGIEAGGTKFVCGMGTGPEDLKAASVPTTTPDETLARVTHFFRQGSGGKPGASSPPSHALQAIGIGSFGPIDLHRDSAAYGCITSTPKAGWANYDIVRTVENALGVPVGFDTDVNAALLGEARWGAARGLTDAVYFTIGTGIGGGAIVHGRVIHGLVHPEMGHLRIPHDLIRDPYPGGCPYHGDCFEGLACGPALNARWGGSADLAENHPAWALEAHYIALGVANLTFALSPQRVLLGGGVMHTAHLFPLIRNEFRQLLNGYVRHSRVTDDLDKFIVPPQLGGRAGVLGALVLAEAALDRATRTSPSGCRA
jgi:fructokinase